MLLSNMVAWDMTLLQTHNQTHCIINVSCQVYYDFDLHDL